MPQKSINQPLDSRNVYQQRGNMVKVNRMYESPCVKHKAESKLSHPRSNAKSTALRKFAEPPKVASSVRSSSGSRRVVELVKAT